MATRGPKPKPAAEVKRNSITFRALDGLRLRLMEAAAARGASLSEEIALRLEQSFDREAIVRDLARLLHEEQNTDVFGNAELLRHGVNGLS